MAGPFRSMLAGMWPPVPAAVRDDLAMLRYASLQAQVPLLYATTIAIVIIAAFSILSRAAALISVVMPLAIVAACLIRLTWWLRHRAVVANAAVARTRIMRTTIAGCVIVSICSVWTVLGWGSSVQEQRSYLPMFMALGILSAAFCMSTIRATTFAMVFAGLAPPLTALVLFGNHIDRIAAIIITVAAMFLMRMAAQRHDQLVALLLLQQQTRELAGTDPLTGLANRRRLLDRLQGDQAAGRISTLLLLDLDGFKPVNDLHGHAVGDHVLCAVAQRLRDVVDDTALVCRMGGDEFAVIIADAGQATVVADRLLTSLIEPISVGDLMLRIGASVGIATAMPDAPDPAAIIAAADVRLYAAKAARNRPTANTTELLAARSAATRSGTRG